MAYTGLPRYGLIVAGGSGKRMGKQLPKQFLALSGKPILFHTIQKFIDLDSEMKLCIVLPKSAIDQWDSFATPFIPAASISNIFICEGGASRAESVYAGLQKLKEITTGNTESLVAIHDGVRPFISVDIMEKAFALAEQKGSAVVCVPVKSSMRKKGKVASESVDRSEYFHVQTPQVFHLEKILKHYEKRPNNDSTDDAGLAESMGDDIHICEGSYANIKITTPEDLAIAQILINREV